MTDELKSTREQSSIAFPYNDLEDAIGVAKALLEGGGVPLSRDQLGAVMDLAPSSGNFSLKLATARLFGLMETSQGKYQLTPLGFNILDPNRQKAAMAEAFLNVPLYRKVFDEFRGKQLPPRPHGLETAFVNFGVAPKQRDKARHAFDRSARLAGFFHGGNEDRLIEPIASAQPSPPPNLASTGGSQDQAQPPESSTSSSGASAAPAGLHKSILGMLDELPPSKSDWSREDQAAWLEAVATLFQVIYKSSDQGRIKVTVE